MVEEALAAFPVRALMDSLLRAGREAWFFASPHPTRCSRRQPQRGPTLRVDKAQSHPQLVPPPHLLPLVLWMDFCLSVPLYLHPHPEGWR